MIPTSRRRPFASLPYLLAAFGLSFCGIYGKQWYDLPDYSDADIAASVELNLQMDLQRRGPHLQPDAAGLERMRQQVRAEVEGDVQRERESVQTRFALGLVALVLAIGQFAGRLVLSRAQGKAGG